jgi:hypothetical protein
VGGRFRVKSRQQVRADGSPIPSRAMPDAGCLIRAPTPFPVLTMVIVYNSESFYVVEYPSEQGFEVVDKCTRRGAFLRGDLAERFRCSMQSVIAVSPSEADVDDFLGELDALMTQRVTFH